MSAPPRLISAVHACRKHVPGLEDEAVWRAFLVNTAGRDSLREMDGRKLGRVLDALHQRGAPKRQGKGAKTVTPLDDRPQVKMARGLWIELHKAGAVRDPSEQALVNFAKRVTGKHRLEWCTPRDLNKLVEALKDWQDRVDGYDPVVAIGTGLTVAEGETRDQALVQAIWNALADGGAFRTGRMARLDTWLLKNFGVANIGGLDGKQASIAVKDLGAWLRKHSRQVKEAGDAA